MRDCENTEIMSGLLRTFGTPYLLVLFIPGLKPRADMYCPVGTFNSVTPRADMLGPVGTFKALKCGAEMSGPVGTFKAYSPILTHSQMRRG